MRAFFAKLTKPCILLLSATVTGNADFKKVRSPDAKKRKTPRKDTDEEARERRASLRVGTGKKGRAAEITQRRGSLRRRDRSADKAAKEEAAIERKTVHLPE